MLKSLGLVLCIVALLPVYAFFPEKALSQSVGVKECDFEGRETYTGNIRSSKILKATLKPSSRGYSLEIQETNGKQVFGLTKQLNYYYDSSNLFSLEGISPALISSDGSFILILPHTPRRGCTYKGKLIFENGSKAQLFRQSSSQNNGACQDSIVKSKIKIESANIRIVNLDKQKHNYSSYPNGRYMSYSFWIIGSDLSNLKNSPRLLSSLSADIISNCSNVGIVNFGLYQSEGGATYGLMKNGTIQKFKCLDADRNRQTDPWGYVSCV